MIQSIAGQLLDWKYGRKLVLSFLQDLTDEALDEKLPRKELNTIRLQIEELALIQYYYIDAMVTKKMTFNGRPEIGNTKEELRAGLIALDARMEDILKDFDGNEEIIWGHGGPKNIHEHFSAMAGHEMMHIGQIVAFCYAVNITIPKYVVETMFLDG